MKYSPFVNVFHGNGIINLPSSDGLASKWHPFKGKAGNTNPAAVLPFGKYSACAYSGGYPTGYGNCKPNSGEAIRPLKENMKVRGFSHLQQSGTGAIRVYYNYAVVTPVSLNDEGPSACPADMTVTDEKAHPGYYAVTLCESGIRAELTVSDYAAYHRYTFPPIKGKITVDFLNDGLSELLSKGYRSIGEDLQIKHKSSSEILASVTLQGVRMHFDVNFEIISPLCVKGELNENHQYCFDASAETNESVTVVVRVSFAASEMKEAEREAGLAKQVSFNQALAEAENRWEEALSKIEIDCDDETERTLFYSNYYHSLIKPSDWNGGGFLWEGAPFVVDFATFWDIYKTALPFIYTFYPEVSAHIVQMLNRIGQTLHRIPNSILLSSNTSIESAQARMLAQYTLYDAWVRNVRADWQSVTKTLIEITDNEEYRAFEQSGKASRTTHTLDMSEAGQCVAEMCKLYGYNEEAARFYANKDAWKNAFDPKTGLLREDSEYYEGNHINYSFRLFRDMPGRIELAGGKEAYREQLDRFFGFEGEGGCFEGFNNETDMESLFAYHSIGAFDRIAAIWQEADRYVFRNAEGTSGPDALPGNNDSGALSTLYIWNTLGLFPVSGQNKMLISVPKFRQSVLHLTGGKDLTIIRTGEGTSLKQATFNGQPLPDFTMKVTDMMQGGMLCISCAD